MGGPKQTPLSSLLSPRVGPVKEEALHSADPVWRWAHQWLTRCSKSGHNTGPEVRSPRLESVTWASHPIWLGPLSSQAQGT